MRWEGFQLEESEVGGGTKVLRRLGGKSEGGTPAAGARQATAAGLLLANPSARELRGALSVIVEGRKTPLAFAPAQPLVLDAFFCHSRSGFLHSKFHLPTIAAQLLLLGHPLLPTPILDWLS